MGKNIEITAKTSVVSMSVLCIEKLLFYNCVLKPRVLAALFLLILMEYMNEVSCSASMGAFLIGQVVFVLRPWDCKRKFEFLCV